MLFIKDLSSSFPILGTPFPPTSESTAVPAPALNQKVVENNSLISILFDQARRRLTQIVEFGAPLALFQKACDLAQQLTPTIEGASKQVEEKAAHAAMACTISNLALNILKLKCINVENDVPMTSPLTRVALLSLISKDMIKTFNWLAKMDVFTLSSVVTQQVKAFELINTFLSSYIQLIESMLGLHSRRKTIKTVVQFLLSFLKLTQHFYPTQVLKLYFKPIAATIELMSEISTLYDNIMDLSKNTVSAQRSAIELSKAISRIGLHLLVIGSVCGTIAELSVVFFILTATQLCSEALLLA